jgi:hypothetical protein
MRTEATSDDLCGKIPYRTVTFFEETSKGIFCIFSRFLCFVFLLTKDVWNSNESPRPTLTSRLWLSSVCVGSALTNEIAKPNLKRLTA